MSKPYQERGVPGLAGDAVILAGAGIAIAEVARDRLTLLINVTPFDVAVAVGAHHAPVAAFGSIRSVVIIYDWMAT